MPRGRLGKTNMVNWKRIARGSEGKRTGNRG